MASLTGVLGSITLPAACGPLVDTNVRVNRWDANIVSMLVDNSRFGQTTNWKDVIRTAYHLTGTWSGFAAAAASTALFGTTSAFGVANAVAAAYVLTSTTSETYSFSGISSQLRIRCVKIGMIEVSGSFISSGAVTPAAPA